MKQLISNPNEIYINIDNYFWVEESSEKLDVYSQLKRKMLNGISEIKRIIKKSNKYYEDKRDIGDLVNSFFVESGKLMDLVFQIYNIHYKLDKKHKFTTFYTHFNGSRVLNSEEKYLLELKWFEDINYVRNLNIHESEAINILQDGNKILFQLFNDMEQPTVFSELCNEKFYINFKLYVTKKLNEFFNFIKLLFDSIVKEQAHSSFEQLEAKAKSRVYQHNNYNSNYTEEYEKLFIEISETEKYFQYCIKQEFEYFNIFKLKKKEEQEQKLENIIKKIESQELDLMRDYYKADVYLKLAIFYSEKNKYEDVVLLLQRGYEKNKNIVFISNIICVYANKEVKINDELKEEIDCLINNWKVHAFMNFDYNFFNNASVYYEKTNRINDAIEIAEMGVNMVPFNYDINLSYNYGRYLMEAKFFAKAISVFEKVIELEPKDNQAYYRLISCYYRENKHEKMYEKILEAIRRFPKNNEFYIRLIELFKVCLNGNKKNITDEFIKDLTKQLSKNMSKETELIINNLKKEIQIYNRFAEDL